MQDKETDECILNMVIQRLNTSKRKDKKLGEAIDHIGHIYREVDADIFQQWCTIS